MGLVNTRSSGDFNSLSLPIEQYVYQQADREENSDEGIKQNLERYRYKGQVLSSRSRQIY
jgi:hypothetical protein